MYNILNIVIHWNIISIELTAIFIICIIVGIIPWLVIKIIVKKIYNGKYDEALNIIQKLKNNKFYYKKSVKEFLIKNEMIVYCFLNNRDKFDLVSAECRKNEILPKFWNIMFYFINDSQNKNLNVLIDEFKNQYEKSTYFKYIEILNKIRHNDLKEAYFNYHLIEKKIKSKVLKKYITFCLEQNKF